MPPADPKRILVIDGHPDPQPERFVHALADSYRAGAESAGHDVRLVRVAELDFPLLRTAHDYRHGELPPVIRAQQQLLLWAQHVAVLFPLWLGSTPALLKGYFEQALRPDFAFGAERGRGLPEKLLKGRSARVIVTMGMPGMFYTLVYRAHSLRSLERNILAFVGFAPIRDTVIGSVEELDAAARDGWLATVRRLGRRGS
ncbi:MAG: NAD(P)H-dependent oxidoreductase [Gammaproteobacteria bacterium]|nr:NAD(P)H-dependent oxidoreductase [Gammaproteobacteria bacterium]